ncbi:TPA: hypothetical protein ACTAHI_001317 [Salmonella enterica subsp. enterica serovar Huettwilen]|nr:hypothetical protein [Salmonella enterica]EDD0974820.1 hypothetical protein [Salmonella enterica subsp. enterica serovar Huettwilen]EDG2762368.1 hypothetical protein [Salmonella enterica subsp. enterica serovar Huettwilen]
MFINADLGRIHDLIASSPTLHASQVFGNNGTDKLSFLMDRIKIFYQHFPAESVNFKLMFYIKVENFETKENIFPREAITLIYDFDNIHTIISSRSDKCISFEVLEDGSCALSITDENDFHNDEELRKNYIFYSLNNKKEHFYIGPFTDEVVPLSPMITSNFCAPTYRSLDDALKAYYIKMARETTCKILQSIWHKGVAGARLFLNNKPEHIMRDSLVQALNMTLKDADVRAEQNTDDTKPVDIKISWFHSKATALIEIKWIGTSLKIAPKDPKKPFTIYDENRAREGAKQLIEYIDNEFTSSPERLPQAYLVVFDARRKNLVDPEAQINKDDAFFYENHDIEYNPEYYELGYFNKPYRFYLRPRYSSL